MISIPLIMTPAHECHYLPSKMACTAFVQSSFQMNNSYYEQLLAKGYRRSGTDVYKPTCPSCSACIPARIAVAEFKANRNQKRCLLKNKIIQTSLKPAIFKSAHYDLYLRYQQHKHPESSMQYSTAEEFIQFLSADWSDTFFVEFCVEGLLIAVAVVDLFSNALSAVYTFFDPAFMKQSPGVYAVLWQIDYAKLLGLEWLYLGYWIADCQKMAYKIQYQPLEIYQHGAWQRYEA